MTTRKNVKQHPTTIRLRELKAPLQEEAMRIDRSLHWVLIEWIRKHPICAKHLKNKKTSVETEVVNNN